MKKRYLLAGAFILLIVISTFFASNILEGYARLFRLDNATKGADCILVLSGNSITRPEHAAMLVKDGYSEKLYRTDEVKWEIKHKKIRAKQFDMAADILAEYNLTADIIPSTKGGATSTFDEAYDFVLFLQTHPMDHIILVTDSFHTARAHYAFRKVLNASGYEKIKLEMSAAPNNIHNETNWWKSEAGLSSYILEPIKYLFYIFNNSNTTLVKEN